MLDAPPLLAVHVRSEITLTEQGKYFENLETEIEKTPALITVRGSKFSKFCQPVSAY